MRLLKAEINVYSHETEEGKVWVHFRQLAGDIHDFLDFYSKIKIMLGLPEPGEEEV